MLLHTAGQEYANSPDSRWAVQTTTAEAVQQQVELPQSPVAPGVVIRTGEPDPGYKRRIPKQVITAEDRASMAAVAAKKEHPYSSSGSTKYPKSAAVSSWPSYATSYATKIRTQDYVLPLPKGAKLKSKHRANSGDPVSGGMKYQVPRRLSDVWRTYEINALSMTCFKQGLWPTSWVRGYNNTSRAEQNMTSYALNIEIDYHTDCYIKIDMRELRRTPTPLTEITVDYRLPSKSKLTFK
jgi:hypothetical protein